MKKKRVACCLVVSALMLSLCACGNEKQVSDVVNEASEAVSTVADAEEVTAEDLLNGIDAEAHKDDTMSAKMIFVTDMESQMEEGSDETVAFKMSADIDVTGNKDASYAKGIMNLDVLGMQTTQNLETYSVLEDDGTITNYNLEAIKGVWTKSTVDNSAFDTSTYMKSLKSDYFTDLTMETTEDGYVVSGNINAGYLSDSLISATGDYANMTTVDDTQVVFTTITFDKDTKEVKKILFDFGKAMESTGKMNINEFTVSLEVLGYSKDAVEVPESVIANAVDSSELEITEETSTSGDAALDLDSTPLNELFGLSENPTTEEVKQYGNGNFDKASDSVLVGITQLVKMNMNEINEKYLANFSEQDDDMKKALAYMVKAGWLNLEETSDELTELIKNLE